MRSFPACLPVLAAALVAAAALPSAAGPAGPAGPHHRTTTAHHDATLSGNQKATRREARRLLNLAPIPESATRTNQPDGLTGPAMGTPATASLVDDHRLWHTDERMAQVYRWIRDHQPEGLKKSGSSSGGTVGKPPSYEGLAWDEPDRRYAVGLELDMDVARGPNGRGTTIRADGIGLWLDPRPIRDRTPASQRLRVSTNAACPASDRQDESVSSPGRGLGHRLALPGRPTAGIVCVYGGANNRPRSGLVRTIHLDPEQAARFAERVARLRLPHTDGDSESCPMDDGSVTVAALRYRQHRDVDYWLAYQGCGRTSNGHIETQQTPPMPKTWRAPQPS